MFLLLLLMLSSSSSLLQLNIVCWRKSIIALQSTEYPVVVRGVIDFKSCAVGE